MGFSGLQKCTAAMRMMAYGISADDLDEYLQMSERTVRDNMYGFARGWSRYLVGGTYEDLQSRMLRSYTRRTKSDMAFPVCLEV